MHERTTMYKNNDYTMKMILLVIGFLLSLAGTDILAQKVQYKKGEIYVDKELRFEFMEVNENEKTSKIKHYALKDLDGNPVFTMTDTTFYYEQLPNEISKRKAYEAYLCSAPAQVLEGVINIKEPCSYLIQEGNVLVGKINLRTEGSNNHAYEVTNHSGVIIGEVNIFQTPVTQNGLEQYRYNLKQFILGTDNAEDNYKWFYERVKSTGTVKSTNYKLEQVAVYMVNEGLI